ncbi:MAG: hypothetical protein HY243_09035 [Proteobacteria bacterium]|nr:hypothetical protein [Pseudomonadota bacterium]
MEVNSEERGQVWIVVAVVVAVVIWTLLGVPDLVQASVPLNSPEQWADVTGRIVGSALIKSLVAWAVLGLVLLRRHARAWSGVHFAILFAAVVIVDVGVLSFENYVSNRKAQDAEFRIATSEVQKILALSLDPSVKTIDQHVKAQGDAGTIEGISRRMVQDVLKSRQDLNATVLALDYPAFLKPARLASDRGLVKTRAELNRVREVSDRQHAEVRAIVARYRAQIASAQIDEDIKERVLKGFDEGYARQVSAIERAWKCDDALFSEMQVMLSDLARAKSRWVVRGNAIAFSGQNDLDTYKAHRRRIEQLAGEENAIIASLKSQTIQAAHAAIPEY